MPSYVRFPATLLLISLLTPIALAQEEATPPPSAPPARMTETEAIAALQAELAERAAEERFSGAVLVAKDGKPIFQQAYGYADSEQQIPNTPETKFIYGSMAKMFTGVAVMQLVEAGKIKLDDPVSQYLPDYANGEVAAATIHQLLTHTAGTGDIFGPDAVTPQMDLREHKEYVDLLDERAPLFPPGSKYEYSNYGMVLLGRIIEVASGQSYSDYVRDHIFLPAGMTSTDNLLRGGKVPGLAIPYTRRQPGQPPRRTPGEQPDAGPLRPRTGLRHSGTAAGGGYSTVGDFLKFATALTTHQLLSPESTELVTTGKVDVVPTRIRRRPGANRPAEPPRQQAKYAYGFLDALTPDGVRNIGHNGGSQGVNGSLTIYPESGYVVVVLANLDPPAAGEVERFVQERLPLR